MPVLFILILLSCFIFFIFLHFLGRIFAGKHYLFGTLYTCLTNITAT